MPEFRAEAVVVPEVVDKRAPGGGVDVLGAGNDNAGIGVYPQHMGFDDDEFT